MNKIERMPKTKTPQLNVEAFLHLSGHYFLSSLISTLILTFSFPFK